MYAVVAFCPPQDFDDKQALNEFAGDTVSCVSCCSKPIRHDVHFNVSDSQSSTLVCRNLSYDAAEGDIREVFSTAKNVSLMMDHDTGRSKG